MDIFTRPSCESKHCVEIKSDIVVDNFLYENLKEHDSYCMYELSETPLSHKTQLLSNDDFVLTGRTKPELIRKGNAPKVNLKGENSVFGYRLTSDSPKKVS
jgi:hypothetical protein